MYTRHWNTRVRILAAVLLGTCLSFCARTGTAGEETLSPSVHRDHLRAAFHREGHAAIPELSEGLHASPAMVRRTAAHLLARLGEPARPALEQALEHPDGQVRRIAAASLPRDEILALHIGRFLEDPEPVVRGWAWGYLAQQAPGEDIVPRVMAYLSGINEGGDAEVRQQTGRLVVRWYTETGPAPEFTDHVRPGETNHLAVRVKNSGGAGGIHGPVHLRLYRASGHGQGRQE